MEVNVFLKKGMFLFHKQLLWRPLRINTFPFTRSAKKAIYVIHPNCTNKLWPCPYIEECQWGIIVFLAYNKITDFLFAPTSHGTGFKFSRCSYVLSLLRPDIYKDLELKVGLKRTRIRFETGISTRGGPLYLSKALLLQTKENNYSHKFLILKVMAHVHGLPKATNWHLRQAYFMR